MREPRRVRFQGTITKWKDVEGYGFITPRGGGNSVFLHARALEPNQARPTVQQVVTYEISLDEQKRERAVSVRYVGGEVRKSGVGKAVLLPAFLAAIFFTILFGLGALGKLHIAVPCVCLIASLIAYGLYAHDKSSAQANEWRVSEAVLHFFALIGGWPGAIIAQHQYRHKLKKPGFMATFWLTVSLNVIAIPFTTLL